MVSADLIGIDPVFLYKVVYQRESGVINNIKIKSESSDVAAFHAGAELREEFPGERLYLIEVIQLN